MSDEVKVGAIGADLTFTDKFTTEQQRYQAALANLVRATDAAAAATGQAWVDATNKRREAAEELDAIQKRMDANAIQQAQEVAQSQAVMTAKAVAVGEAIEHAFEKAGEMAVDALKEIGHWLVDITVEGAKVAHIEDAFETLTAQAGDLGDVMGALRAGTHNTVTDFQLMKMVNKDLVSGLILTSDQFKTMSSAALALSHTEGIDVAQALEKVNMAMLTGQPRLLRQILGKVDLTKAEKAYADQLVDSHGKMGVNVSQLTVAQKLDADRVGMLDLLGNKTKLLGDQQDGLDDVMQQANVLWKNFEEELGKAINKSPVVIDLITSLRDTIMDFLNDHPEELIHKIVVQLEEFAITLAGMAPTVIDTGAIITKVFLAGLVAVDMFRIGVDFITVALGWVAIKMMQIEDLVPGIDMTEQIKKNTDAQNAWISSITQNVQGVRDAVSAFGEVDKGADAAHKALDNLKSSLEKARDHTVALHEPMKSLGTVSGETAKEVENCAKMFDKLPAHKTIDLKVPGLADVEAAARAIIITEHGGGGTPGEGGAAGHGGATTGHGGSGAGTLGPSVGHVGGTPKADKEEETRLAKAREDLAKATRDVWAATDQYAGSLKGLQPEEVEAIANGLKHNIGEKELALYYGVTIDKVKGVQDWTKNLTAVRTLDNKESGITVTTLKSLNDVDTESLKLLSQNIDLYGKLSGPHKSEIDYLRAHATMTEADINKREKSMAVEEEQIRLNSQLNPQHKAELEYLRTHTSMSVENMAVMRDRLHVEEELGRVENINNDNLVRNLSTMGTTINVMDTLTLEQQQFVNKTHESVAALTQLGQAFINMAQVSGDKMGPIVRSVGQIVVGLGSAQAAVAQAGTMNQMGQPGRFGYGSVMMDPNATTGARVSAGIAAGTAVVQGAMDVWQTTQAHRTTMGNAGAGALAGAQAGSAFGPYGMAVGAAAGFVVGLVRGVPDWAKLATEVGHTMGVSMSDELAHTVQAQAEEFYSGSQQMAEMANMPQILSAAGASMTDKGIVDAGGHIVRSLDDVAHSLTDALQGTRTGPGGATNWEAAGHILDQSLPQLLTAATDHVGVLSQSVRGVMDRAQTLGIHSEAIDTYKTQQAAGTISGISGGLVAGAGAISGRKELQGQLAELQGQRATASPEQLKDIDKNIDQVTKSLTSLNNVIGATQIHTQGAATAISSSLMASVAQMVSTGTPLIQVIQDISPSIQDLKAQLETTGLSGGEAFDYLNSMMSLVTDEVAGPALQSMASYGNAMVTLNNTGQLTQDEFAGLTEQITGTHRALIEQGKDGGAVLVGMQQPLQQIWELVQDGHYAIDDETQALLDQAVATGEVGEKHRTEAQQSLDLQREMVDQLHLVAQALTGNNGVKGAVDATGNAVSANFGTGGKVQTALAGARGAVSGVRDELNNLPTDRSINIVTHRSEVDDTAPTPPGRANPGGPTTHTEAAGSQGIQYASGPMTFTTQGNEEYAFSGEGRRFSDTASTGQTLVANIRIGDRLFVQQMLKLQAEELRRSGTI